MRGEIHQKDAIQFVTKRRDLEYFFFSSFSSSFFRAANFIPFHSWITYLDRGEKRFDIYVSIFQQEKKNGERVILGNFSK